MECPHLTVHFILVSTSKTLCAALALVVIYKRIHKKRLHKKYWVIVDIFLPTMLQIVYRSLTGTRQETVVWISHSISSMKDIGGIMFVLQVSLCKLCFGGSWWRHQMEIFPRHWPFVRGITGHRSPAQRPVTLGFDVLFDLRLNKLLRKQSGCWWFETPSPHYDVTVMFAHYLKDNLCGTLYRWQWSSPR